MDYNLFRIRVHRDKESEIAQNLRPCKEGCYNIIPKGAPASLVRPPPWAKVSRRHGGVDRDIMTMNV
jgi:hypothetical protein